MKKVAQLEKSKAVAYVVTTGGSPELFLLDHTNKILSIIGTAAESAHLKPQYLDKLFMWHCTNLTQDTGCSQPITK